MAAHTELLPDPLPADPLVVASQWLDDAWAARTQPNANSMVLATSTRDGRPSARVVLCKDIVPRPGYVVFYTNFLSQKGRQLRDNPRAAAVMHWDALHRQVRIEGAVTRAPESDSDGYFASRAWQSRIGAWASDRRDRAALRRADARLARRGRLAEGYDPAPAALGRLPSVGRRRRAVGGRQRAHPRPCPLDAQPRGDGRRDFPRRQVDGDPAATLSAAQP